MVGPFELVFYKELRELEWFHLLDLGVILRGSVCFRSHGPVFESAVIFLKIHLCSGFWELRLEACTTGVSRVQWRNKSDLWAKMLKCKAPAWTGLFYRKGQRDPWSTAGPSLLGPGDSGWVIMNSTENISPINQVKVGSEWPMKPHGLLEEHTKKLSRATETFVGSVKGRGARVTGAWEKKEPKRCCQLTEESIACHQTPVLPTWWRTTPEANILPT